MEILFKIFNVARNYKMYACKITCHESLMENSVRSDDLDSLIEFCDSEVLAFFEVQYLSPKVDVVESKLL